MNLIKFWLAWTGGVIIAMFAVSLWQNDEIDWGHIITMSIGGLIGLLIAGGIKKIMKKTGKP